MDGHLGQTSEIIMRDIKGKTIFISGGASGIGLGVARAFAGAGANVAIGDIDLGAAQAAAGEVKAQGVEAIAIALDVSRPESWAEAADTAEAALGPVSLLHSNAGVGGAPASSPESQLIENIPVEDWRWLMNINVDGHFFALKTFLPRLKARSGSSHVIFTGSVAGLRPTRGATHCPYVVSKCATIALAEHTRLQLEATPRIGVSVLCPGVVTSHISRNSAIRAPSRSGEPAGDGEAWAFKGMSADNVGLFTLKGVRDGDFYIMTHPEYRDVVQRYHADIIRAFGSSAEPGYADPIPVPYWLR
jgi:NAD(P)-dependent dehydrogenase (short-subunit alcohol dehydrogenase family)